MLWRKSRVKTPKGGHVHNESQSCGGRCPPYAITPPVVPNKPTFHISDTLSPVVETAGTPDANPARTHRLPPIRAARTTRKTPGRAIPPRRASVRGRSDAPPHFGR